MKRFFPLIFLGNLAWAVAPVVSPSTPVVNQGGTIQFSETLSEAGTWSCSGTNSTGGVTSCAGSINSATGLYTAPATVVAHHTYAGLQVLPNNDVYNVRIDSLPLHPNNTTYISVANQGGIPHWNTDEPINYVLPTSSTATLKFLYTPANNGGYEVPSFPDARAESGWFSALQGHGNDHHVLMIDTTTATFSEFYQYHPTCVTTAASVTNNVATLTCTENPVSNEFLVGSTVVVNGFSGADTYFNVASAIVTAVTATSISYALTHANASASTNGSAGKDWIDDSTGQINSASGIKYRNDTYALPPIATDAAGMQIQPLILDAQEVVNANTFGGEINHAFRNTFGLGFEASSNTWPATTFATDGNTLPFGVRSRLKSSFDISSYSAIAQILLRALQHYGMFNVDGGNNWPMSCEVARWPKAYYDALQEIGTVGKSFTITNTALTGNVATITAANDYVAGQSQTTISGTSNGSGAFNVSNTRVTAATPTQFSFALTHADIPSASDSGTALSYMANYVEFVDESSIMISTGSGLTNYNREIVKFTRTSDSVISSSVDVVLQGPAVNLPQEALYFMAGAPAQQLVALNNFGGVTWSMSPAVGTLTNGGFYTPPTSVVSMTTSTVTVTSLVQSSVTASMLLTVFQSTGIYVIPSKTANYTDSTGNVWYARSGLSNTPDTMGCCACGGQENFPATTDISLWNCAVDILYLGGDTHLDFIVPNGTYQVTYHYGTKFDNGVDFIKYSIGNTEVYPKIDPNTIAGGKYLPFTSVNTTTVTNNKLQVGIWNINDQSSPISSLSVVPILSTPSQKCGGNMKIKGSGAKQ